MLHTTIIYQLVYAGYVSTLQILVLLLRLVVMLLKGLIEKITAQNMRRRYKHKKVKRRKVKKIENGLQLWF